VYDNDVQMDEVLEQSEDNEFSHNSNLGLWMKTKKNW
jgi:hypothetical protein